MYKMKMSAAIMMLLTGVCELVMSTKNLYGIIKDKA